LVKILRDDFGVTLAGGQDQSKGKVVRIAHLDTFDIIISISALELTLKKFGANIEFGKGVAAAQEILLEAY
jgi:aspartate aminotransferase-like enzyme